MKAISQTFLSTSRPDQAYRSTKSFVDSISRGATAYSRTMAHQGYGLGTGPMRMSQYDDRVAGQNRPEYDGVGATAAQTDSFGRSQMYADGASFHPASSASYDLRVENTPLLGVHNQHHSGSPGLSPYETALPHHQNPYAHYPQASPHIGHSAQTYLPQQHLVQHPQQPPQQHQQHQHPLGMQMSGDLTSSQPLNAHMGQTSNGLHHQSGHPPNPLDAQRKASSRADEEPHTPRPPNAWILYRSQKFREIQQSRDSQPRSGTPEKPKSQAEISRIISQMWQNENSAVKQEFEALADEKKLAHQRMYPTYRYRPKKKGKAKQSASAQSNEQRSMSDGHLKKRVYGFYGGNQEEDGSEARGSGAGPSSDRKGGEPQRTVASQGGVPSFHDMAGRDRKPNGDRRDRNDLQVPINYGRTSFGNIGPGEGHVLSYGGSRMHPYADRPSRSVDVFGEASTHMGSHWPESDTLSGSSGSAYGDGARGQTGYTGLGPGRLHSASLLGNNAMGGAAPLLAVASPQQRSVPSKHLHSPMDHLDGSGLTLSEFASADAGSSGFRANPLTNHPTRFMPFGDSRSETASGMVVTGAGNGDGLGDSFDPHRRSHMS